MNALSTIEPATEFCNDWRRWVAENILFDAPVEGMIETLLDNGFDPEVIRAELLMAMEHPYVAGGKRIAARLAKRDWVLAAIAKAAAMEPRLAAIERRHRPDGATFLRDFWSTNRPVLMTGLIDHWPARRLWSLDHLDATLGDREVEVQLNRESDVNYETQAHRFVSKRPLGQIIQRLRDEGPSNDFYLTARNGGHNRQALAPLWDEVGGIPGILSDGGQDGGFFWMGPQGTITPFHHDLTNNLLLQVVGRKRVVLVPSWEVTRMRNQHHCFSEWPGPDAIAALPDAVRPLMQEVVIEPGEALFIPIGWFHYVEGLDTTIGMSFTGFAWDNDYDSFYTSRSDC
ncbi:cupin-like domain-containing protein [Sphingomonas sp. RS2018]